MRKFSSNTAKLALARVGRPVRAAAPKTAPGVAARGNTAPKSANTAAGSAPTASTTPTTAGTSTATSATNPNTVGTQPGAIPNIPRSTFAADFAAHQATSAPSQPDIVNPETVIDSESLNEDWATSFQGLGSRPFDQRVIDILMAPVVAEDVEVTPDGLLYLPEIKYRRILNRAFGPGGWGIAPRTKSLVTKRQVTREYGLVCLGRLVSVSRGEMDYFSTEGVTTAMEGCKSNALMRCCKDLGIASELWDPAFIRAFKSKHCDSKYFEKKKRFVWKRKDRQWEYPYV